jgi:hypothetical protein
MGVINLIVYAHDARDAAHRLTAPVSGGRRRPGSGPAAPAMNNGASAAGLPATGQRNPDTAPASCSAASRLPELPRRSAEA